MSAYRKFFELTDEIKEAMLHNVLPESGRRIVDFLRTKNENYSYDPESKRYFINSFYPSFPGHAWSRAVRDFYHIAVHKKRIPIQADIVVTGKCQCRCWHCFRAKNKDVQMLDLETIKHCFSSLYDLGTATVGITGGEPMLHPDILEIIKAIPDGIEGQLYTTGHNIDKKFVSEIKHTNLTRCIISLDHYQGDKADELRHYPGAFKEALTAIEALTDANIYTAITVCITNSLLKEGEIQKYFDFVETLGINEIRIVMPIPQGNLEGKDFSHLYCDAIKFVKDFKKEHFSSAGVPAILNFCEFESPDYMGCSAGAHYLAINNDGAVTPCVAVPLSFGNIFKEDLKDIFERMEKFFPISGRICYGKRSGRVISRNNINTTKRPLPEDISLNVAEQCSISSDTAAFFKCFDVEERGQAV
jgi:Radical SAM superfamily.